MMKEVGPQIFKLDKVAAIRVALFPLFNSTESKSKGSIEGTSNSVKPTFKYGLRTVIELFMQLARFGSSLWQTCIYFAKTCYLH